MYLLLTGIENNTWFSNRRAGKMFENRIAHHITSHQQVRSKFPPFSYTTRFGRWYYTFNLFLANSQNHLQFFCVKAITNFSILFIEFITIFKMLKENFITYTVTSCNLIQKFLKGFIMFKTIYSVVRKIT